MRKLNCYLLIFLLLTSIFVVFTPSVSASDTLYERYNVGNDGTSGISDTTWRAQTFTIGNTGLNVKHNITSVKLLLYKDGVNNPDTVTVYIETVNATNYPTNTIWATGTTNGNTLTTDTAGEWREIFFTVPYMLNVSTRYVIVIKTSGLGGLRIHSDDTAPTYTGGTYFVTTDSGTTWTCYPQFDILFEEYGASGIPPSNLAVSGFTNATISLTWNTGANRNVFIRNATGYPATPYLGTEIYNNTGTSYTDTGLLPSHKYYYRAWNWNGTAFSANYSSINQTTRPNPPYNTAWVQVGGSINISWLNGTGSNKTVLRMSSTTQPILPQDGTEIYNGTGHYKVQAVTGVFYITLFSYNTTSKLFSSPGVNLSIYFIYIRCYNESSGLPITGYSVFFTNPLGTQTYTHDNCTNPFIVNTTVIPQGNDISLMVNKSGYNTRTYIFDIIITGNYYITTYLPPITAPAEGGEETPETNLSYLFVLSVVGELGEYGTSPPIEGAKVTVQRYINATVGYETVGIMITDANGQCSIYLRLNVLYKVTCNKSGFIDATTDYITDLNIRTKTFRIHVITPNIPIVEIFTDTITFNAVMYNGSYILINYDDINHTTINTHIYVYEILNDIRTLIFIDSKIANQSYTFNATPINKSRNYLIELFFNNSNTFDITPPVYLTVLPIELYIPSFTKPDFDDRVNNVVGPPEAGGSSLGSWWSVITVAFALVFLAGFGPFHTGFAVIGSGVIVCGMEGLGAMLFINTISAGLIIIGPVAIFIGIIYMMTKGETENIL